MKHDVEHLLRDFIEWAERRGDRVTVRVPPPPPVPKDMEPLGSYLQDINYRVIALELDESMRPRRRSESHPELEMGANRVEELRQALAEARERLSLEENRRHSSMTWTKRTAISLLLSIIGVLILAIAALTLKLIDSHSAPAPQPRQEEAHPR